MDKKKVDKDKKIIYILILIIVTLVIYIGYIKLDTEINTLPAEHCNLCFNLVKEYNQIIPVLTQNYEDIMTCYIRGISPCTSLNQRIGYNYEYGTNPNFVIPKINE